MALVKKKLYETRGRKPEMPGEVEIIVHLRNGETFGPEPVDSRKLRWEWTDYYTDEPKHLHDIMYFELA